MWLANVIVLLGFLLLGAPSAWAQACSVAVHRYDLTSDSVQWSMQIGAGQSCIGGFRVSNVSIDNVRLIAPPTSGEITLQGPGFRYRAKPNFQGQDSFSVIVSGLSKRIPGLSIIRVLISVVSASGPPARALPPMRQHRSPRTEGRCG